MRTDEEAATLDDSLAGEATMQIATVHKYDGFYTPLEERFERITRLAKNAMGVHAAAVTLVRDATQWFKSVAGWRVSELPLETSFCKAVLEDGVPVIVPDTKKDARFSKSPLVIGGPKFRFYAGHPIRDIDGDIIGTFCVFDVKPKDGGDNLYAALQDLAHLTEREFRTTDLWNAQNQLVAKLGAARRQALLDVLTRVWNRRGGMEILDSLLEESRSSDERIAVCVVDIDLFKEINDAHGHNIGDQALRKVAAGITASVRPNDIVARYGGDEFLVILRDADTDVCRIVAERIRDNIQNTRVRIADGNLAATISIGMAISIPGEPIRAEQLIERADKALYHSKDRGRNMASLHPDDID